MADIPPLLLKHVDMRLREVGLRRGSCGRGDRRGHRDSMRVVEHLGTMDMRQVVVIERVVRAVTVHECLKRHKLRQLPTQYLGISTQMVHETVGSLVVLSEVADLGKASCVRMIHQEVGRASKLNDDTADFVRVALVVVQVDVLDEGEGVLDLVSSLVVIDVVSDSALIR